MDRDLYRKISLALEEGNKERFGEYLAAYIPLAEAFLVYTFRADKQHAYDITMAVIENLLTNFETVREKEHKNFSGYLITALRNEFLYGQRKQQNSQMHEAEFYNQQHAYSYDILYESVRKRDDFIVLKRCLDRLSDENFRFIRWIMRNPRVDSKELEDKFGQKSNTLYQRKHRIINRLSDCIKKEEKKI